MVKVQVNSQGKVLTTNGKVLKANDGSSSKYGFPIDAFIGNVDENKVLQYPDDISTDIIFSGFEDVADNALSYTFYQKTNIKNGVVFPDLKTISGIWGCFYMFLGCTEITSASFSSFTTVSGEYGCYGMFYNCMGLTSVSLPSLTTISGEGGCCDMFYNCMGLTSVSFPSLTTVSGDGGCTRMFGGCTNLEHIYFNSLTTSSFGSYTNQFYDIMSNTGTSKTHTIHFPSNLESTIQTLRGYPLFGGENGYVVLAFDLPATE